MIEMLFLKNCLSLRKVDKWQLGGSGFKVVFWFFFLLNAGYQT